MATQSAIKNAKVRSHITGNVEAAKQFLVVAIGLGLTNAIGEKLKTVANQAGASDPLFHYPSFVLFVFGLYAIRFFFNNYIYLHQSYGEHRLNELEARGFELSPLIFSSGLDLGLSIFTGIIMSIISMTLLDEGTRLQSLIVFLLLHYVIDAAVLGRNIAIRRHESDYHPEYFKVFCWLISNTVFFTAFAIILALDVWKIVGKEQLFQILMISWLVNSIINLTITFVLRERAGTSSKISPVARSTE